MEGELPKYTQVYVPSAEILEKNLLVLERVNPHLRSCFESCDQAVLEIESARDGLLSGVCNGRRLASRHAPGEEADRLVNGLDIRECATACVLGFGLGHHIERIAKSINTTGVVIVFEPDLSFLKAVLSIIDITQWAKLTSVFIVTDPDDSVGTSKQLEHLEPMLMLGTKFIEHPQSMHRLGESSARFTSMFTAIVSNARMTVVTTLGRSAETIGNILANYDHYALGSGLNDLRGIAKGRLGIVVSAGPSLRRNIHELALPGVRDRCVIIATQTTLRPLLDAGVKPHYVTALDYHAISSRFYEGLTAEEVADTELIIDPKVNPIVPDAWPGRIRTINSKELDVIGGSLGRGGDVLEPCATVAHFSYVVARYMGCDPVALIGQDLGFTDALYYAPGTAIHDVWLPELSAFNTIETMEWERIARHRGQLTKSVDVHGRTIFCDQQMRAYLQQFEVRFKDDAACGLVTIDATEGGVRKKYTQPKPLADVLEEYSNADDVPLPRADEMSDHNRARYAERLVTLYDEVKSIRDASHTTVEIIDQMLAFQEDSKVMPGLFTRIENEQKQVAKYPEAFRLVDMVNQAGVFRRLKADRILKLSKDLSPLDRQRAELSRDRTNVSLTSNAAHQLLVLLDKTIRLIADGDQFVPEGGETELNFLPSAERSEKKDIRVAAVVAVDPLYGGTGIYRELSTTCGGRSILQLTLERLSCSRELSSIVILVPDEYDVSELIDLSAITLPVVLKRCGKNVFGPEHAAIQVARACSGTSWRGGIHGLSVYDEVFAPVPTAEVLQEEGFDGALLVGPDWCLLPVAVENGVDSVVARFREQPSLGCTFNQAPPGLGGLVLGRECIEEYAGRRVRQATIGHLSGYRPEYPEHDRIAREHNVSIEPHVRSSVHRAIFDTPRQRRIFEHALESSVHQGTEVNSSSVLASADAQLMEGASAFGPQHVTIEICTGRAGAGVARADRLAEVQRPIMDESVFRKIVTPLGRQKDCVLTLGGSGDPLRHPHFDRLVGIAREVGIPVIHVHTELIAEKTDIQRLLDCSPDVVSVDIDGDSAKTRRAMHGVDHWDLILENMKHLLGGRRVLGDAHGSAGFSLPWIVPRLQRRVESVEDIPAFFERWRRLLGTGVIDGIPVPEDEDRREIDSLSKTYPPPAYLRTRGLREMNILSDGTVPSVAGDWSGENIIGDIRESGLIDVWCQLVEQRRGAYREESDGILNGAGVTV